MTDALPPPRPTRIVLVVLGWGSCFVLVSWGLPYVEPLWFATLRAVVAAAALAVAVAVRRRRRRRLVGAWLRAGGRVGWQVVFLVALLALVNVAIALAAMFGAATGVASGVASVLSNAQPLLIVLPAWALYGEALHSRQLAGLVGGLLGLGLLAAPDGIGGGVALSVTAAVAVTAGTLLTRRLRDVDLVEVTAAQFVLGAVILSGYSLVREGPPQVRWTPVLIAVLLALALGGTAAPALLWFAEIRRSGVTAVTTWTLLVPVTGLGAGVLVLGESLSAIQVAGVLLVLVALTSTLRRSARPA